LRLHYLDWGNEGAPLLVLIHGMRDHAHSWDWTARALRERWHVVAPDLRGHGESEWSPDGAYLAAYNLLDIADLIEVLGGEHVTLIGHSFGGNIAARYAAIFHPRVRKLVLVDGAGATPELLASWTSRGPVQRTREWIQKRREIATQQPPRRFATMEDAVARMSAANPRLSAEQARHLTAHGVRLHTDGYGWKYDPATGNFLPEDFAVDLPAFWREIHVPTLLCHGTESWQTNPESDGRAAHFRDHRTVAFDNAGHWLHHDQLEAFLVVLREFL
jgi:pimeloyl-ACP methyl ester carboxylesterase